MSDNRLAGRMIIDANEHPELMREISRTLHIDPSDFKQFLVAPYPGATPVEKQEFLKKIRGFAETVVDENKKSALNSSHSIRRSYWTLYFMYSIMFTVGIVTAIVAIIKGSTASSAVDTYSTLIFAGLSAASFFTLFITRPLESLERNSIISSWLIAVTNTYWTALASFDDRDPDKAYDHLKKATDDLTKKLGILADKHATAMGKYSALAGPEAKKEDQDDTGKPKAGPAGQADNTKL